MRSLTPRLGVSARYGVRNGLWRSKWAESEIIPRMPVVAYTKPVAQVPSTLLYRVLYMINDAGF